MPGEDVESIIKVIESDFGPIGEVFERFDLKPCGCASIGQAHTARLKDGREVAVKVQYPDAEWKFTVDIRCLEQMVRLTQSDALPIFREFAKQFLLELDYETEKRNIKEVHTNIMPHFNKQIVVVSLFRGVHAFFMVSQRFPYGSKKQLKGSQKGEFLELGAENDKT